MLRGVKKTLTALSPVAGYFLLEFSSWPPESNKLNSAGPLISSQDPAAFGAPYSAALNWKLEDLIGMIVVLLRIFFLFFLGLKGKPSNFITDQRHTPAREQGSTKPIK